MDTNALCAQPWPVGFFQAARLMQLADGDAVGRYGRPSKEAVRFGASTAIAFPASEVQSIEPDGDGPARMRVNVMGLTGPVGVMPLAYTALLRERERAGDHAGRDFLDLFHHRLLSLFYRAWMDGLKLYSRSTSRNASSPSSTSDR